MGHSRISLATALCLAATAAGAGQGPALPPHSQPATVYGAAKPLPASLPFCQDHPAECAIDLTQPARITLDKATWAAIVDVNRSVNKAVQPISDQDHWGIVDRWDLPEDGKGDCEDYALLKRHLLAERGFPRRAMRMTVVINEMNEGHAVLTLLTDRGDIILDNRFKTVTSWFASGYEFIKRESGDGPGWVLLRPQAPQPDVPVAAR